MSTIYHRTIRISRLIGLFLIAALLWSGPALANTDSPPQVTAACATASDECWEDDFHVPGVEGVVHAMAQDSNGNVYVGGDISAAGGIPVNNIAMWDGAIWHDVGGGTTHETASWAKVYTLAVDASDDLYVGGTFDHAGDVAAGNLAKWTGSTWEAVGGGTNGAVMATKIVSGGVVIGGGFTQVGTTAASRVAYWNTNTDSWVTLGSGVNDAVYAIELEPGSDNLFIGGAFTAAGGHAAYGIARYDGATWGAVGGGLLNTGGIVYSLLGVAQEGGGYYLYVGGAFSQVGTTVEAHNIARWDGSAWTAIDYGIGGEVRTIAVSSAGVVYVGGDFSWVGEFHSSSANVVAMTLYGGWFNLEDGVGTESYEAVNALLPSGNGLIVGGVFELADNSRVVNNLARWGGSSATWSSIDGGAGVDGAVDVLLGSSSTSSVYAAGSITHFGSLQGVGLAQLFESTWMEKGNPATFGIRALAASRLVSLYAGGAFTSIGGVDADHLAWWNGAVWSEAAGGTNGCVNALVVDSIRTLYVGGEFTEVGEGTSASHIAIWDGSNITWRTLGEGLDGDVRALALDASGNLYAGGEFDYAGDLYVNHIAMWDGSEWHALGTGLSSWGYIGALTFDADGRLYASGHFSSAGDTLVNGVTVWDGVGMWNGYAWSVLGMGMNAGVDALVVDANGYLYAGGDFDTADLVTVNHIARWDGFAWSALGSGTDSNVFALAIPTADRLVAGGAFKTAGAKPSSYIGAYTFPAPSTAPVPQIDSLTPRSATEGFPSFWLTVDGSNFSSRSVVRWNGAALTTTYVSSTRLKAFVPAVLIEQDGASGIDVYTPAPAGGGVSYPRTGFKIVRSKRVYLPAVLRLVE